MEPYKRPEMEQDPTKLPGQIVNPVHDEMVYGGGRGGPKNWFNMDGSPTIRNPALGARRSALMSFVKGPADKALLSGVSPGLHPPTGAVYLRDIIARIEREEEYSPHATINS